MDLVSTCAEHHFLEIVLKLVCELYSRHPAKTRQARPGELQTERGERTVGLASCLGDYGLTQGDLCWRVFVCSASLDLPPTWKFLVSLPSYADTRSI